MNRIQSRIARIKIKSPGYWERRRQEMIRIGWDYEQNAAWRFCDARPGYYLYYESKATMYRKRAAWSVHKQIEEKYGLQ